MNLDTDLTPYFKDFPQNYAEKIQTLLDNNSKSIEEKKRQSAENFYLEEVN